MLINGHRAYTSGQQELLRTARHRVNTPVGRIPILDAFVFLCYVGLLSVTITKHEPWFDEAQAWLLARDSSLSSLLFNRLRYEGHPGLWYVILWVANALHVPYFGLNVIGAAFAATGVLVWLRYSPFPNIIRYTVPFSYFLLYQFAVVARSYVLLPLFMFLAAHWFGAYQKRTYSLVTALSFLALVSIHGTLIASSLVLSLAIRAVRDWRILDGPTKRRLVISSIVFVLVLVGIAAELYPPVDLYLTQRARVAELGKLNYAFEFITRAFAGNPFRTLPVLLITVFLFARHRLLDVYILPTTLLLLLSAEVWASPWHEGVLVLVWLMTLWIMWPRLEPWRNVQRLIATTAVAVVLIVQIRWSWLAIRYDLVYPYSGSRAAADYLKSVGAERGKVYAYENTQTIAVLPYFSKNIIDNFPFRELGSAWHWTTQEHTTLTPEKIRLDHPDFVLYCLQETDNELTVRHLQTQLDEVGYTLKARFDGHVFFAAATLQPESFLVFGPKEIQLQPSGRGARK